MKDIRDFLNELVKKYKITWKQVYLGDEINFCIGVKNSHMRIFLSKSTLGYFWHHSIEDTKDPVSGYRIQNLIDLEEVVLEYIEDNKKKTPKL